MPAGEIVGTYFIGAGQYGFVEIGGVFTTVNDPNGVLGTTNVFGVNDSGDIVGSYTDASGVTHGFVADPVAAPEPGVLSLLLAGLLGLALISRRKRILTPAK